MKYPLYLLLVLASACGDNVTPPMEMVDAPPAAQTIAISGTATQRAATGSAPVTGATVGAYANTDETTPLATATTDADGNYTLTLATGGVAFDGYIKATAPHMIDTYLYEPEPITADYAGASINMLVPTTYDLLANSLCRANQDMAMGLIALEVADATKTPIQGATVASAPAATTYCYDSSDFPSSAATVTDTDGLGYMFNVTGDVMVSATKSGSTFKANAVKARPGVLTTTLIQP